jgi:coenzyme F420-reducing hydrogenase delta subunit/ferredoxin
MRLIRVMCSGRVDLSHVLKAFVNGADGVFIGACHLNECNYVTHGNYHALSMVTLAKRLLEHVGLNPERLRIAFMSGSEANIFVDGVNGFVKKVKSLGPVGDGEALDPQEARSNIADMMKLVPYIKLVNQDKLASRLGSEEEYEGLFTRDDIEAMFRDVVSYYIDPEKCQACSTCLRRCPVDAISGGKNLVHVIDQDACIKCGTCLAVCPPRFDSVRKISGEPVPPPLPEEARTVVRKKKSDAA